MPTARIRLLARQRTCPPAMAQLLAALSPVPLAVARCALGLTIYISMLSLATCLSGTSAYTTTPLRLQLTIRASPTVAGSTASPTTTTTTTTTATPNNIVSEARGRDFWKRQDFKLARVSKPVQNTVYDGPQPAPRFMPRFGNWCADGP